MMILRKRPRAAAAFYGIHRSGHTAKEHRLTYPVHGGGGYVVYPNGLMLGGEGGGGGAVRLGKSVHRYAGEGQGFFTVGYSLLTTRKVHLYIITGIGGGGGGLTVKENKETTASSGGGGVLKSLALGFELRFGGRLNLVVGAQIGMIMHPLLVYFGSDRRFKPFFRLIAGVSGREADHV